MAHGLGSRCCLERLATFETNRIQAMQPVQEILYRTAVGLTRPSLFAVADARITSAHDEWEGVTDARITSAHDESGAGPGVGRSLFVMTGLTRPSTNAD